MIQTHGYVEEHHLDKASNGVISNTFISRMREISYESSLILFLFTPPQKLTNNPPILNTLLECHACQTLRLVAIDEAHLYAQHNRTFRDEFRILARKFFPVVFKIGSWHPLSSWWQLRWLYCYYLLLQNWLVSTGWMRNIFVGQMWRLPGEVHKD